MRKSGKSFELTTMDRTYYLFSKEAGVCDAWIFAINSVLAKL